MLNNRTNVLLIVPEFSGTIAKVSHNLFSAIKEIAGIKLFVAILDDRIRDNSLDFGDDVYIFKKSKYGKIGGLLKSCKYIAKLKKDLSIDVSISTLLGCNMINAGTRMNDKTIGIFHAPLTQAKLLGRLSYYLCVLGYKLYLSKLDKIVAVSETVKDYLCQYTNKQVDVIYNIHYFDVILQKSNQSLESNDEWMTEKPYIIYVGGLYDLKGPDRLIKSFAKSKLYEKYNLIFIGADVNDSLKNYKKMVLKLCLQDSVYFIGYRSNPYPYIKKSQFLVSPSRSEGLPGVIIESLYLGIPVVSTNSSKGVFEIMECLEKYDSKQSNNLFTKYGIITPNTVNETLNEDCLADALKSISKVRIVQFNYKRFTKDNVIDHLLFNA